MDEGSPMKRTIQTVVTLALVAAAGAALGSCNIVGPAAYIIGGQPKVEAQFALSDRPTVVFVDDPENILPDRSLRRLIGDRVAQELMVKKRVSITIRLADAMAVAGRATSTRIATRHSLSARAATGPSAAVVAPRQTISTRPTRFPPKLACMASGDIARTPCEVKAMGALAVSIPARVFSAPC